MHIALIRRKYDLSGGAELSLRLLVQDFVRQGRRVSVLAQSWQGRLPEGMDFYPIAVSSGMDGGARSFAVNVQARLKELKADVVLSLERVPGVSCFRAGDGCHAAWLARRAPYAGRLKRFSFACNPRHLSHLKLEAAMLHDPALKLVIANSRMVAEEIRHYYQVPEEKIALIHNPVDGGHLPGEGDEAAMRELAAALELAEKDQTLLFLGSGFERKGLAFLIRALALLPAPVKLLVAGRDDPRAYARLAGRLGLGGRVRFLGLHSRPGLLLGLCSAMILPTIYDPCANSCLEALAAGKPVVTTLANGAKDFIRPGENGFLVAAPEDSRELAGACASALALARPVSAQLQSMAAWREEMSRALGLD